MADVNAGRNHGGRPGYSGLARPSEDELYPNAERRICRSGEPKRNRHPELVAVS